MFHVLGAFGCAEDENLIACALRELFEETKLTFTSEQLCENFADSSIYQPHGRSYKRVVMYLTNISCTEEPSISGEHDKFQWCSTAQALELLVEQELRRTLVRAASRICSL